MKSLPPFFRQRFYLIKLFLITGVMIGYLDSCTLVDHPPQGSKYLVSSTLIGEVTKQELALRLAVLDLPLPLNIPAVSLPLYDIKVYKIVYKTKNPAGQEIQASGALIVPKTTNPVALISQQHGTITSDANAPSNYGMGSEAYSFASIFASNGFIISCPDYIGFGSSGSMNNLLLHTYEHREGLAQASLDMLRAAKELIQSDNTINWDTRLYLTGYSEGGFATMSLYKKMQDETSNEFNLKAVSTGAGAYDKTSFMKELLTKDSHGISAYNQTYLWVLLTYDRIYGLNRPLESYFVEPYLDRIKTSGVGALLDTSFDKIFTTDFKNGVANGTDTQFLAAVADNNVYDWKPLKPLQLYHGTKDPQVFFLNSLNAYTSMKAKGMDVPVYLLPIVDGTHQTSLPSYVVGTFIFFKTVQ